MNKWGEKKLKDIGVIVTGNTPPTKKREFYGEEYKFIKPTDMTEGLRFVKTTEEMLSLKGYKKYVKSLIPSNTPCIVTIGSLGKKLCLTDQPSFTNQAVNAIIPFPENDGRYIYYYMKIMLPTVKHLSSGTASGRENVSKSSFSNIKILVPQFSVQQKIANILSAYDDLIENNNQRIQLLEKAVQNLYKEWFVRFRFPNYKQTKFEKGLPEGWGVKKISEFVYVTDGTHDTPKQTESGYYLVTGKCIINDFIDFSKAYFISENDHKKIKKRSGLNKGDILFSNIGTIGSVSIIDYDMDFSVKNVIILKFQSDIEKCYLYCLFKNSTIQNLFNQQTNGSSQQFISLGFMRKFKIVIPHNEILRQFTEIIQPMIEMKYNFYKQNRNLIKQRDLLLSRLMSRKLEIPM